MAYGSVEGLDGLDCGLVLLEVDEAETTALSLGTFLLSILSFVNLHLAAVTMKTKSTSNVTSSRRTKWEGRGEGWNEETLNRQVSTYSGEELEFKATKTRAKKWTTPFVVTRADSHGVQFEGAL